MAPKMQFSKERILDAALQLVIRDGHEALSIKQVAMELQSSTQPISWTFGSMEHFRKAFAGYVIEYLRSQFTQREGDPVARFVATGEKFLHLSFTEPNLIRYVWANSRFYAAQNKLLYAFGAEDVEGMRQEMAQCLDIDVQRAAYLVRSSTVYIQGLVFMIISGMMEQSYEDSRQQMYDMIDCYLDRADVPRERFYQHLPAAQTA